MPALALVGGTVVLPDRLLRNATVLCERGKIVALGDEVVVPKTAEIKELKGE